MINVVNRNIPTYYAPASIIPKLEAARDAMMALDSFNDGSHGDGRKGDIMGMKFVGVQPGDELPLPIRKKTDGAK